MKSLFSVTDTDCRDLECWDVFEHFVFSRHVAFLSECEEEGFIVHKMHNRNDRKHSYKQEENNLNLDNWKGISFNNLTDF